MDADLDGPSFGFLCELILAIGKVKPRRAPARASKEDTPKSSQLLQAWVARVRSHTEPASFVSSRPITHFFRLFFPEEGARRRYGLQEAMLSTLLEKVLCGNSTGRFRDWNLASSSTGRSLSPGCLGATVAGWLSANRRGQWPARRGGISLVEVDRLLNELASSCAFSHASVRANPSKRSKVAILSDLLNPLGPCEIAVMIQILLRDLSPIMYPPPSLSADVALLEHNSAMYHTVTTYEAMKAWHPGMPAQFRAVADLDFVGGVVERAIGTNQPLATPAPILGMPVQVPKSLRPGTCAVATKHLRGPVACETKYDGERLQVHIDLSLPADDQIQIFSKSTRDSTRDRHRLLPIIRASLGLALPASADPLLVSRVSAARSPSNLPARLILEGEMVPFNEAESRIDEFWRLGEAKGGYELPPERDGETQESASTGHSQSLRSPRRRGRVERVGLHLMAVWFDVLLIGEESLLRHPYEDRRNRLATIVKQIHGFSMLAERTVINFDAPDALPKLRRHLADIIAARAEGLMLKPLNSAYNDFWKPMKWVKLKKDFIPGAGDTLDFHLVGARWDRDRGRELVVPPSTMTTFFVGLRADHLGPDQVRTGKPHYHVLFASSYGLDRRQLSMFGHQLRQSDMQRFAPGQAGTTFQELKARRASARFVVYESACTSFTFSLADHLRPEAARPAWILPAPRVCELTGAGFQKAQGSPYYELRWPRVTKLERDDGGAPLSLLELQEVAEQAMVAGRRTAEEERDRRKSFIWDGMALSPEGKSQGGAGEGWKRRRHEEERERWIRVLEKADGVVRRTVAPRTGTVARTPPRASVPPQEFDAGPKAGWPAPFALAAFDGDSTELEHLPPSSPSPRGSKRLPRLRPSPTVVEPAVPPQPALSPARKRLRALSTSPKQPPGQATPPTLERAPESSARLRAILFEPKRARLSEPLPIRSLSSPALPTRSRAQPRHSLSLPPTSLSSTCLALTSDDAAAAPALPSSNFFWSVYSSTRGARRPEPRHSALDEGNFLRDPLSVLWAAGWPIAGREPRQGSLRQGVIFVKGEKEVAWLKGQVDEQAAGGRGARLVQVALLSEAEQRGEFDLCEAVLWVFC